MTIELSGAEAAGMNGAALNRLDAAIRGDVEKGVCDGAVYIVARGGRVVRHEAVGLTDLEQGRSARTDDIFCMMSLAKSFTAVKILRLCDEGRLTLATPIAKVIPEFGSKGKDAVTIFHAMTHTGGIWSGFSPPPPLAVTESKMLAQMIPAICNMPLAYEPGTQVTYCPFAGHSILGEVIARLDPAQRGFNRILREDVFEPLGMHDTTYGMPVGAPRRVPLVQREEGPGGLADRHLLSLYNTLFDETAERPGGGAFATAADVYRFAEMLRRGGTIDGVRMLSSAITAYALQNHTGKLRNTAWDYSRRMRGIPEYPANFALAGGYMRGEGFFLTAAGATASPGSFVAVGGGSTMFLIDPERDLTFVFLCAGLLEGLNHFVRLQRLSDLALAAVEL